MRADMAGGRLERSTVVAKITSRDSLQGTRRSAMQVARWRTENSSDAKIERESNEGGGTGWEKKRGPHNREALQNSVK